MWFRLLNFLRAEFVGKTMIFLAEAGARNRSPFDRVARFILHLVFAVPKHDDFMADDYVDNDEGYDLDELKRYQSGQ